MYIARYGNGGSERFQLRESFRSPATGILSSRNIFDLGSHPGQFLHYPGVRSIFFDERLLERLSALNLHFTHEDLETLFLPFVRKDLREFIEFHLNRAQKRPSPLLQEEERRIRDEVHPFDKRRYLVLRSGPPSAYGVHRTPAKFFRRLLGKSRDELEQYFLIMEAELRDIQLKEYACAVFGIGQSLPLIFRHRLEAMDEQRLDELFLDALHQLESDTLFWTGLDNGRLKVEYLSRYAIMFFDHAFSHDPFLEHLFQETMKRRQRAPLRPAMASVDFAEAEELLGIPLTQAKQLSKRALTRLYRKRAKELHPDSGGGHEAFVRLNEVYQALLRDIR